MCPVDAAACRKVIRRHRQTLKSGGGWLRGPSTRGRALCRDGRNEAAAPLRMTGVSGVNGVHGEKSVEVGRALTGDGCLFEGLTDDHGWRADLGALRNGAALGGAAGSCSISQPDFLHLRSCPRAAKEAIVHMFSLAFFFFSPFR